MITGNPIGAGWARRRLSDHRWWCAPLIVMMTACATLPSAPVDRETGVASWYGEPFHGRLTANGERYDMHAFTAAHRLYAFGTRLRVTNRDNGQTVIVRVNDRGPFVRGRIIDLSFAAATAIDMIGTGTARVSLQRLPEAMVVDGDEPAYTVQVAAFRDEAAARTLQRQLNGRYGDVFVMTVDLGGVPYYRVRVGRLATISAAQQVARRLDREGFTPFVTRQDPEAMLR